MMHERVPGEDGYNDPPFPDDGSNGDEGVATEAPSDGEAVG